jgi:hypothetical protein
VEDSVREVILQDIADGIGALARAHVRVTDLPLSRAQQRLVSELQCAIDNARDAMSDTHYFGDRQPCLGGCGRMLEHDGVGDGRAMCPSCVRVPA